MLFVDGFFEFFLGCDRTPIGKDFPGHFSSDEEWHGYINNNDRVLLKVCWFLLTLYSPLIVAIGEKSKFYIG